MKVIADIIDAADCQKVTLLSLLDMSAAFDTSIIRSYDHRRSFFVGSRHRMVSVSKCCSGSLQSF